jgi:hypothetical protein
MKKTLLILLLIFVSSFVNSQFYKKHEDNQLKFYGIFDTRNSIVFEENLGYYGIKIGMGNKRVRFGFGYHILHKSIVRIWSEKNYFKPLFFEEQYYSYKPLSIYIDPILYQTQRWELLLPIHLGVGPLKAFEYDTLGNEKKILTKDFVPSITVSIKANYRVFKWIGVTAGFGDNFVFLDDSQFGKEFNTFFYSFGVKLFFDEFGKFAKEKEYRKKYLFKIDFIDD